MSFFNIIQNYLLPPLCILCGDNGFAHYDLCRACYHELPRIDSNCSQCGTYFKQLRGDLCSHCINLPPPFDRTIAPFMYSQSIAYLIKTLKFHNHYKNARLLGSLLADQVMAENAHADCLIPMPLHRNRYRERGFNQTIEIGRIVSKQLRIPLSLTECIRKRDTPHQVGLSASQRQMNVQDAFAMVRPLQGKRVAIIDDVMSTGASVRELAKVLKQAGVMRVEVWVCAR